MTSAGAEAIRTHEIRLQRAVTVWIVTGLLFMLLPGTYLGAWNLIEISGGRTSAEVDPRVAKILDRVPWMCHDGRPA
jgi:hypothetical protein